MGEEKLIGFTIEAKNGRDAAYQARFTVDYPSSVRYDGYDTISENGTSDFIKCKDASEEDEKDDMKSIECSLGNPFKSAQWVKIRLRFKKSRMLQNLNETSFFLSRIGSAKYIEMMPLFFFNKTPKFSIML